MGAMEPIENENRNENKRRKKKGTLGARVRKAAVFTAAAALVCFGAVKAALPSRLTFYDAKTAASVLSLAEERIETGSYGVTAKLFGAVPIGNVTVEVKPRALVPCGQVFGVKFFTKGVIVIGDTPIETADGFVNPAKAAGLAKNDIILSVNGRAVNTVEALAEAVEKADGKALTVVYRRGGKESTALLVPVRALSDGRYKSGLWVRDSTAGIGTMTYYDPETGAFAGLGHGICDVDTGELMPLLRATVVDVHISDIVKGRAGVPGELKGSFDIEQKGTLTDNTALGVYGVLEQAPCDVGEALSVAGRGEVHDGEAYVLTDPDGNGVQEYSVRLSRVDPRSDGIKSFVVEVTDPHLKELTGGIVQGMSGSPIVQDGKLVGAVTHVLVNDPTKGYGIFIENMLAEAEKSAA